PTGREVRKLVTASGVRDAKSIRWLIAPPGNRIGRRWSTRAVGSTSCRPAIPPAISRRGQSPQRPPQRRRPPQPGRQRPARYASSTPGRFAPAHRTLDGELAEDGPRDVSQHHHHVPERPRRPYQFLALGRCRDRQVGDVLLVDGERRFLGYRGLP